MKLTVGSAILPEAIPESYSVEIKVMGGDADYYDTFSVSGFEPGVDDGLLEDLLRLLARLDSTYPNGRGGSDSYSYDWVPGFEAWFSDSTVEYAEEEWRFKFESPEQKEALLDLGRQIEAFYEKVDSKRTELNLGGFSYPYWPSDATTDGQSECTYESYEVFYYDEDLTQHRVDVEL